MAKRKDARVTVIMECTSCMRNGVKKVPIGIFRYITQKNRHNIPLLQTYNSWGNKEIDRTKYVLSPKRERLHYIEHI